MTSVLASRRPILCLVTDRRRLGPPGRMADVEPVVAQVRAAARAGVDLVQVRERDLEAGPLATLVSACVEAARGSQLRVLVNDRLDVAVASGAHGVHLRSDSLPADRVRAMAPEGFLLGRSVHGEREARTVASTGVLDYLVFGTVFSTGSKPPGHLTAGVETLDRVARSVPVPVLGIGGIDAARLPMVAGTAAAGIAAIGYFAEAASGERQAPAGRLGQRVEYAHRCFAGATTPTKGMIR